MEGVQGLGGLGFAVLGLQGLGAMYGYGKDLFFSKLSFYFGDLGFRDMR